MKYLYKFVIAPMYRLIWATIYSLLIIICAICAFTLYTIWNMRFGLGLNEGENIFEYITNDGMLDKYSTVYKSPFHWVLNIGGVKQLNSGCITLFYNHASGKSSFKDYVEITKRDLKIKER
jgi:hypothetical protein